MKECYLEEGLDEASLSEAEQNLLDLAGEYDQWHEGSEEEDDEDEEEEDED